MARARSMHGPNQNYMSRAGGGQESRSCRPGATRRLSEVSQKEWASVPASREGKGYISRCRCPCSLTRPAAARPSTGSTLSDSAAISAAAVGSEARVHPPSVAASARFAMSFPANAAAAAVPSVRPPPAGRPRASGTQITQRNNAGSLGPAPFSRGPSTVRMGSW